MDISQATKLIGFLMFMTAGLAGCATAVTNPIEPRAPTAPPPTPTIVDIPTLAPTLVAGSTRLDRRDIEQVWVPAGTFQMGSEAAVIQQLKILKPPGWLINALASEQPAHAVTLTHGYWIDKYEVTNAAFKAFVEDGGYQNQNYWSEAGWQWLSQQRAGSVPRSCTGNAPDQPRACVTWYEAEAYARWRSGRLPTEAEWEFAARGPDALIYPWGNDFDPERCNVIDSRATTAVGAYPNGVSWVGAHDLSGNVMEWVQDWLDVQYYSHSPTADPTGPNTGKVKVEKGGWWGSNLFAARSAYRHFEDPPDYSDGHIGFRIVTPED